MQLKSFNMKQHIAIQEGIIVDFDDDIKALRDRSRDKVRIKGGQIFLFSYSAGFEGVHEVKEI